MNHPLFCNLAKTCSIFLFLLCCNTSVNAQHDTSGTSKIYSSPGPLVADSISSDTGQIPDTVIQKTHFDHSGDSVKAWKRTPEFSYVVYLDSLLKVKRNSLKIDTVTAGTGRTTKSASNTNRVNYSIRFLNSLPVRIFFWSLAVLFIAIVVYKLFLTGGFFENRNRKNTNETIQDEPAELSDAETYHNRIREAESANDFMTATRYLYLQLLRRLSDKELLLFSPGKTNHVYINELRGWIHQKEFSELTRAYEYIWYGKFSIEESYYLHLRELFLSVNNKF